MRVWRRTLTAAAAAFVGLASGSAAAGTVVEPRLQVAVEERYDDDVLFRTESASPAGVELMTKLTPTMGVNLQQRTLEANAWYAPDFQLRHFSRTFRVDHRGGLDVEKRLSRRHSVFGHFRLWRVADPTSLPRMGVGRTLSPVLYGTADLGLNAQLTERVLSTFRYRFEGTKIFEAGTPTGQVHAPSAELWYRLTGRASVGTQYRFQYFIYGDEHAVAHAPAATFRYRLTRHWTFNARGGPVWYYEQLSGGPTGLAPRAHVELTRAVEGFDVGFQAGQDLIGATGISSAQWAQYAGLYGTVRVNEPFRVFGGAYWYRNGDAPGGWDDYLGRTTAAGQGYAVSVGAEWRFHRMFMLQAQVDRIAQVGAFGPGGDLSRNIAALRLVVTPW